MSNLALGLQDFIQTQSNTIISDRKGEENMLCLKEINPNVKNMKDLDFFMICRRAKQITKELRQVMTNTFEIFIIQFSWSL